MKEINIILGHRISKRRTDLKLTRERLAAMIDVSPRFLAEVEAGKVGVAVQTLKMLSVALQTSTDYLVGNTLDPARDSLASVMQSVCQLDKKYHKAVASLIEEINKID